MFPPPARIALLSDSHDHRAHLCAALGLLRAQQPTHYFHLGDLCDPELLDLFVGLPFHFVFGNNDFDHAALLAAATHHQLHCHGPLGELTIAGKRLALVHGDNHFLMQRLITSQQYDYLFFGHTHHPSDTRQGRTRLINPGALFRRNPKTVALLDLASDSLEFLTLPT